MNRKKSCVLLIPVLLALVTKAQLQSGSGASGWMQSKDELPFLRSGVQTHQQIAYDRAGDNYDHEYFGLYKEKNGEVVLFDAYGPGMVSRHHMNIWHTHNKGIRIRYYFDNEVIPRVDMDVNTFFTYDNPLGIFAEPYAVYGEWDFRLMYCPMYFQRRLKITLSAEPGGLGLPGVNPWPGRADSVPGRRSHWYQFTYHLFTDNKAERSWAPGDGNPLATSPVNWLDSSWVQSSPARAGQQLLEDKDGLIQVSHAGVLSQLSIVLPRLNRDLLQSLQLVITFDEHQQPDVQVPLHAFFNIYPDSLQSGYTNLFSHYDPTSRRLACSYVMPFWKNLRLQVMDATGNALPGTIVSAVVDSTGISRYPAVKTGYFRAAYQRQVPRREGFDYTYLQTSGRGHIIGHNALRYNTSMEENERTYFDGSGTPQIQGNGFEDDQGFGWGLKRQIYPLFGAPVAIGGSGALYRYMITDIYCYYSGVLHGHQVYGPNSPLGHEGQYAVGGEESTTFYYARDERSFLVLTDSIDIGQATSEQQHRYMATTVKRLASASWWYDGDQNNVLHPTPPTRDGGRRVKESRFTVQINSANAGIRLRRRTDKANGRQLASVFIDGQPVMERPWYTVDYDSTYRDIQWFDTDVEIPAKYTKGKRQVHIRIVYREGALKGIDEYSYWVYSHLIAH